MTLSFIQSGVRRLIAKYPRAAATFALWIASCLFISVFSDIAKWQSPSQAPCSTLPMVGQWGPCAYYGAADLCRWDCRWFASVLDSGYDKVPSRMLEHNMANWPFHPVLVFAAYPFKHWFSMSSYGSIVIAGRLAYLVAIYTFLLMITDDVGDKYDYFRAGALVAFSPYMLYGHTGYSEPLYFAFLCLAFYFAGKGHWLKSGVMSMLLSATRVVGVVFGLSYLICLLRRWRAENHKWSDLRIQLIGLLLCPLGAALFMLYLYAHTGDAFAHVHIQVGWWGKPAGNPFITLWNSLGQHHWHRVWGFMCVAALVAAGYLVKLRKYEYAVYLFLAIIMGLSGGGLGLARYVWWQPPLLYAIYCWLRRHPNWWSPYLVFSAGLASFMIMQWFTGRDFVV